MIYMVDNKYVIPQAKHSLVKILIAIVQAYFIFDSFGNDSVFATLKINGLWFVLPNFDSLALNHRNFGSNHVRVQIIH